MNTEIGTINIGDRPIGPCYPPMIVGEVAQAHDGSLGIAHAFIDTIADAGADAVKFQTHIADAESSPQEPFRVKFSYQDTTRFEYWKRMEFTKDGWKGLAEHAKRRGLIFLSSPFSDEAVDLLEEIGMPAWKIASGEANNPLLLEKIARTKKPVLLSTGMSTIAEIDEIVKKVKKRNLQLLIFQCTSKYPSKPEDVGLNVIDLFRQRYHTPVGLSDHSGSIFPGLAAATLGVDMIEVHVTLSRQMFGPDVIASLTPEELKLLVDGSRFIHKSLTSPIMKDQQASALKEMRGLFSKSLVASRALKTGQIIQRDDISSRKPGYGIPANNIEEIIGRKLSHDIATNDFFSMDDFEEEE